MRSKVRRRCAVLAVLAVAYPSLLGAALLVHLAEHGHAREGSGQANVIELIVHGHQHDPGTPDHEHSLVPAKPALESAKRPVLPTLAADGGFAEIATALSPSWYRCAPAVSGPSPPSQPHAPSVLRI